MTKLEEIARAIYAEFEARPKYAQRQMNGLLATELALAAVRAMREPTEAMTDAAYSEGADRDPLAYWEAMIDSILSEAKQETAG